MSSTPTKSPDTPKSTRSKPEVLAAGASRPLPPSNAYEAVLHGLKPGQLLVLGGRPGMGKTALAADMARRQLQSHGKTIAWFTLGTPESDLRRRLIAAQSHTAWTALLSEEASDERPVPSWLEPLAINATPALHIQEIADRAAIVRAQRDALDLVVIDGFEYLRPGPLGIFQPARAAAQVKELASTLSCPVLLTVQLSTALLTRRDKRPRLSDIRHGLALLPHASKVLLLHRDAYFTPHAPGVAELTVHDPHQGTRTFARLGYSAESGRFDADWLDGIHVPTVGVA